MHRRDFLKVVGGLGAAAVLEWPLGALLSGCTRPIVAGRPRLTGAVVAIKRFGNVGEAPRAVEAALEMIGGIDKIIRPGEVVVIKPNLVNADARRWVGRVTNSRVMDGVIRAVKDCGATPVVAEGTCEEGYGTTTGFAKETGLLEVCRRYGAKFVDLNNDEVVTVKVPDPLLWPDFRIARQAMECDRFISVPVLKTHYTAGFTLGMKNLVGTLSPKHYAEDRHIFTRRKMHDGAAELWQQRYGTQNGESAAERGTPLCATIADLLSARPIDLVVVDGTFGDERFSPQGQLVDIKERCGSYLVLAATDAVAVDSVGAHIMRIAPPRRQQIRFAAAKGLGNSKLDTISVVGERLEDVAVPMRSHVLTG